MRVSIRVSFRFLRHRRVALGSPSPRLFMAMHESITRYRKTHSRFRMSHGLFVHPISVRVITYVFRLDVGGARHFPLRRTTVCDWHREETAPEDRGRAIVRAAPSCSRPCSRPLPRPFLRCRVHAGIPPRAVSTCPRPPLVLSDPRACASPPHLRWYHLGAVSVFSAAFLPPRCTLPHPGVAARRRPPTSPPDDPRPRDPSSHPGAASRRVSSRPPFGVCRAPAGPRSALVRARAPPPPPRARGAVRGARLGAQREGLRLWRRGVHDRRRWRSCLMGYLFAYFVQAGLAIADNCLFHKIKPFSEVKFKT